MPGIGVDRVRISDIVVPSTRRAVRAVDGLAASIREVGLLNPITLTEKRVLVAGFHRIEAVKLLGHDKIDARIIPLSDLQRRLATLDENLERAELSELERAEQTAERKTLYEAMHPAAPKGAGRPKKNSEKISAFAQRQSTAENRTDRSVRHEVQIATQIPEDVRDTIRSTPMADRKADLIELSRLDETTQRQVAAVVAEKPHATLKEAVTVIVANNPGRRFDVVVDDAPRRWHKAAHDLWMTVNSIRDNGGIKRMAAKWSAQGRQRYAEELDRLIELLTAVRRDISEGTI